MEYGLLAIVVAGFLAYAYKKFSFPDLIAGQRGSKAAQNAELIKVLLDLEDEPLDDLFKLYKEQFGDNAARYARHTYRKWKAGEVRPNRQTFNRFLLYLPKVMSFDLKCEVLRELREAYCAKDNYKLTVHTDDWKETLTPLVQSIITKAKDAELPQKLLERLHWLAGDDMQIAREILTRSQTRQSLDALSLLSLEFSNIERLLDNAQGTGKVTHVLRLPLGTITLMIKGRSNHGR
jgi:hypothetical protein